MVNRFDVVMVELRKEKYRLEKENERFKHELAMHKDDGSTEECPGCYMERIWEGLLKDKDKIIKRLRDKVRKLQGKSKKSGKA